MHIALAAILCMAASASCKASCGCDDGCRPRRLCEGTAGTYSPDGRRIAFTRAVQGKSRIGVMEIGGCEKSVEWLEKEGNAAYPAWSPDGQTLAYSYGNETNTAWAARNGQTGYHLRLWRKGEAPREITSGRYRDYAPSFSPDGSRIYFATTRDLGDRPIGYATQSALWSMKPDGSDMKLEFCKGSSNSGAGQSSLSRDGRILAWAQIDDFQSFWYIRCARADTPKISDSVTPPKMAAYSPRWTKDGRFIVCTGFLAGDPGWCVYSLNPRSGAVKRICEGRNPDISPDGTRMIYDDGAHLYERSLSACDFPSAEADLAKDRNRQTFGPEEVLFSVEKPKYPSNVPLDGRFAFGADKTFFVRARIRAREKQPARFAEIAMGRYAEHSVGFELLLDKGIPEFGVRNGDGTYAKCTFNRRVKEGEEITLTGIRTAESLYFSGPDGIPAFHRLAGGTLAIDHPKHLTIGEPFAGTDDILSLEIGTGWPKNVKHPFSIAEVFE